MLNGLLQAAQQQQQQQGGEGAAQGKPPTHHSRSVTRCVRCVSVPRVCPCVTGAMPMGGGMMNHPLMRIFDPAEAERHRRATAEAEERQMQQAIEASMQVR
eukprot:COSAG05_NODE_2374_length_3159_cov_2.026471_1_plen_101_part_00